MRLLFDFNVLLLVTHVMQEGNPLTVVGISRIIACIIHNVNLTDVSFSHHSPSLLGQRPSDCIRHHAWRSEGLPSPPMYHEVVREGWSSSGNKGWTALLKYLRQRQEKVRHLCALNLSLCAAAALTLCAAPPRRVPCVERRRRLPHLRPPQRARALFAAARTARVPTFAARA
jgi:hypothetical protein